MDRKIRIDHYRAMNIAGDETLGISTQGTFAGVDDLLKYIRDRGLDKGEALRVERENKGKWIFVQNVVI